MLHEIRVQGHLDDRWADGLEDLEFTHEHDGTTTLRGPLVDQAALHGLLTRMRDLNVPIVSVRRASVDAARATTMRAIVQEEYGTTSTLHLAQIDRPAIGDHDVLIRVYAAGVDRGVWHLMTGRPYLIRLFGYGLRRPKTRVRGTDVAGRVEAAGKRVTRFRPGDEVFGTSAGSFAEYGSAAEGNLALKPANLTFEQAAAVPHGGLAALQGLRDAGKIRSGQKVLIVGASGGVGTFAVQIAKVFGAEVTGVCSSAKVDLVRSIGADHVLDYTREDFADRPERYDLILDIGGSRLLSHLRRALAPEGTLVLAGGEDDGRWIGGTVQKEIRAALLSPFTRQKLRPLLSLPRQEDLQMLGQLLEAGKIMPVIDRTYSLAEVPDALRYLEAGRARGKVVISL